jgi:hypothetical protein
MLDFFQYCGLESLISKNCAEEAIFLNANSPKKLFRYIHLKKVTLSALGMSEVLGSELEMGVELGVELGFELGFE